MNKEPNDEVSDTTEDEKRTRSWYPNQTNKL